MSEATTETFVRELTVICGANVERLDGVEGKTIREVRDRMREVLNVTDKHTIVLVDGKEVKNLDYKLSGREELEFKKPSGEKGK